MRTVVTVIIILILLIIGVSVYRSIAPSRGTSLYSTATGTTAYSSSSTVTSTTTKVREFTVSGKRFSFDPDTIRVNQGDTVKITFVNNDSSNIPHNLTVNGYSVSTQTVNRGASTTIQFVADKTGSFEYYCSVDSHRAQGMKGTLVVE